jgi:hypothetical protein
MGLAPTELTRSRDGAAAFDRVREARSPIGPASRWNGVALDWTRAIACALVAGEPSQDLAARPGWRGLVVAGVAATLFGLERTDPSWTSRESFELLGMLDPRLVRRVGREMRPREERRNR